MLLVDLQWWSVGSDGAGPGRSARGAVLGRGVEQPAGQVSGERRAHDDLVVGAGVVEGQSARRRPGRAASARRYRVRTPGGAGRASSRRRAGRGCACRAVASVVRCAETSTTEPVNPVSSTSPSSEIASRSPVSSPSGERNGLVISHSSGPSQIAVAVSLSTYVDGVVGRATPRYSATAAAAGPVGSTRRSLIATNGRGVTCTPSGEAARASPHATSGAVLVSAVQPSRRAPSGSTRTGSVISTGTSSPATGTCTVCPMRVRPAFTRARAKLRPSSALR